MQRTRTFLFPFFFLPIILAIFHGFFPGEISHAGTEELLRLEHERVERLEKTQESVIAIFPAGGDGPVGGGSGVVISPEGYALTNFHVVQPCGIAMKCGMSDGKSYNAILVGLDPTGDIALIQLLGRNDFPYAPLGNSDLVRVGEEAVVMGNPFMLATDYRACVSYGIISGTHRYQYPAGSFLEYTDCLQTDAAVNPGNSGGPLFNIHGELIGINGRCSFEKRGRINVGIGYAVSVNQIKYFLGDLKSGRIVDHATLNAVLATDRIGRVVLEDLLPTSELYRKGARIDDEMVRLAGRSLDSANTFQNILGVFPRDWQVPITLRTPEGSRHEILVRLDGLHSEAELIEMTEEMMEPPLIPPPEPKDGDGLKESNPVFTFFFDEILFRLCGDGESSAIEGIFPFVQEPPKNPGPGLVKKPTFIPDWAKPVYEKRRGFANYHFNLRERDRVLSAWKKGEKNKSDWTISGRIAEETPFRISITEEVVSLEHSDSQMRWNATDPLDVESKIDPISFFQEPVGSGGMFGALYLFRKLYTSENLDFGEVQYMGTAPLEGNLEKLYDVISVVWRAVRARFYFDPETGRLRLVEYYSMEHRFPCEIWFHDPDQKENGSPGGKMEVINGTVPYALFRMETFPPGFSPSPEMNSETVKNARTETPPLDPGRADSKRLSADAVSVSLVSELERKIVKIYGSGGITGMHGYQSGCIISPEGLILTVSGPILEADPLMVVLDNGRRLKADLIGADPEMEVVLLKVDGENLPYFDLKTQFGEKGVKKPVRSDPLSDLFGFDDSVQIGERILAVSNPFNIATGNEPVSFQQGIIAARTSLRARRGAFASTYKGPVYVVDAIVNNPGAKGGAVVRRDNGRFLGLIGKELKNRENNTWFNFVLPGRNLYATVRDILENENEKKERDRIPLISLGEKPEEEPLPGDAERLLRRWGILLVSNVASRTPPFIDSIRTGSDAQKQGLLPDDLIVMVNHRLTPSRSAVQQQLLLLEEKEDVVFTVERKSELIEVRFMHRDFQ